MQQAWRCLQNLWTYPWPLLKTLGTGMALITGYLMSLLPVGCTASHLGTQLLFSSHQQEKPWHDIDYTHVHLWWATTLEFVQSRRASKVIQPCHGYATPLCSHFSAVCPLLLQPTLCLEVLTENCKPVSPVWTLLHIQAKLYCQVWFPW